MGAPVRDRPSGTARPGPAVRDRPSVTKGPRVYRRRAATRREHARGRWRAPAGRSPL